jgi:hypothetical protein
MNSVAEPVPASAREKIAALRAEFVDLAFVLECRGKLDAADVAMAAAARVAEVADELGRGCWNHNAPKS